MPKLCAEGMVRRWLSAALATVLLLSSAVFAAKLPRASYFLVHSKGFVNGRPNRGGSMLWVMRFLVSRGKPTGVRIVKRYRTQYGLRDEPKRRQGDRSTPEGIYEITHIRKHRRDDLTGPWFFLMSYPNQDDRRRKKTGGAIGIHGGPNRPTLGCIRLRDRERGGQGIVAIKDLRRYVKIGTPVISVPELPPWLAGKPGATLGAEVAAFYAHLLTTPLRNAHVVRLVRRATAGSTAYLAARDAELPKTELVTVSSELDPFGELTYRAYNLVDGDATTCWSEGADGDGVGEWAQVRFPAPRLVRRIRMINGYDKGRRWKQNNRVRRASIQLSDGSSFDWHLEDTRKWQEFVLPVPVVSRYVQIGIDGVYRGSRRDWNDTSISEIAVDSEPATVRRTVGGAGMAAQASSYLEGGGAASGYYAFNAIDGDPSTCWSEGGEGHGIGEWLQINFAGRRTLGRVKIINGYDKRRGRIDRWAENPRVKKATLRFSDGSTLLWKLRDARGWQSINLPRPVTTSFVRLTIEAVYPGTRWEDTSISEIAFTDASPISTRGATRRGPAITASASSTLENANPSRYAASNVLDGDPATCWSEGVPGDGIGERLRIEFSKARRIGKVRIVNGYAKDGLFRKNNRPKRITIHLSDGTNYEWRLKDSDEWQSFRFPQPKTVFFFELVIREVYRGSVRKWRDTSISEVAVE